MVHKGSILGPRAIRAAAALLSAAQLHTLLHASEGDKTILDLTPTYSNYRGEGGSGEFVYFGVGKSRLEYTPPWPITGEAQRARLAIPIPESAAEIKRIETSASFDFLNDRVIIDFLRRQLPTEAEEFGAGTLERNPLRISGKSCAEFVIRYSLFGRQRQASIVVAQPASGSEVFCFQVSSPPAVFEAIRRQFLASLYTVTGF